MDDYEKLLEHLTAHLNTTIASIYDGDDDPPELEVRDLIDCLGLAGVKLTPDP